MKRKATKNHVCMCRNQKMVKTEEVREKLQTVKSRAYERTLTLAIRGRFGWSAKVEEFVMNIFHIMDGIVF